MPADHGDAAHRPHRTATPRRPPPRGDAWPDVRDTILSSDILILSTSIWRGLPSSVAQHALERPDAELGETDDLGRMLT
ncbi:hypothetical protein [Streptomyces sp. NPDC056527]|uniref:hypothetical protein n=1 Tax=Streptomyces sp. NPDC056527 TaxID=3345853 RepID=UPI0036BD1174